MYFSVEMDATSDITSGQILPFRRIKNNVGNGYDVNTFKFRPPYNGTYEFMLQIMAGQHTHCKGEIAVNGQKECRAHTGPGSTDSLMVLGDGGHRGTVNNNGCQELPLIPPV